MLNDITSIDELKSRFNEDRGSVRIVLVVSPTCPICVLGARRVQTNILDKYPDANIRVYAVWFNVLFTDNRSEWAGDKLLTDDRTTHYWDESKVVGKWFGDNTEADGIGMVGGAYWDRYFLYSPDAEWGEALSPFVLSGFPIFESIGELKEKIESFL